MPDLDGEYNRQVDEPEVVDEYIDEVKPAVVEIHHHHHDHAAEEYTEAPPSDCWQCRCQPDPRPAVHQFFVYYWIHLGGYVLPTIFFSLLFTAALGTLTLTQAGTAGKLASVLARGSSGDTSGDTSFCQTLYGVDCDSTGLLILLFVIFIIVPLVVFALGLYASCMLYIKTAALYLALPPDARGEPASFKGMNLGQLICLTLVVILQFISELAGLVGLLFDVIAFIFWIAHLCCFYLLIGRVHDYVSRTVGRDSQPSGDQEMQTFHN